MNQLESIQVQSLTNNTQIGSTSSENMFPVLADVVEKTDERITQPMLEEDVIGDTSKSLRGMTTCILHVDESPFINLHSNDIGVTDTSTLEIPDE